MSVRYAPVQWNRTKLVYDAVVVFGVGSYVTLYQVISRALFRGPEALSAPILAMRAWGSCAFLLLSIILCIGPLARLDPRFLPLLYNRRHAGIIMSLVGIMHAMQVTGFYFAFGKQPKLEALLSYDAHFTSSSVPFIPFGITALLILVVMATTSHDFWQRFLGPTAWKSLHMLVYVAYAFVVVHVAFGALQREPAMALRVLFVGVALTVASLHVVAGLRSRAPSAPRAESDVDWIDAGAVDAVKENHTVRVCPPSGERIALVNSAGLLYAVHGVCAHQRGPLHEGRVTDGCLTCPWHGWQYRPEDGRSPPPFEEVIPTYRLKVERGRVLVDPRPLPLGTKAQPVPVHAVTPEEVRHA